MKKYKALITDVDGTLVPNSRDGMPSPRVRKAIALAKTVAHIGVATGRSMRIASPVTDHLSLTGPAIILGGSQLVDLETKKLIKETGLSSEQLELIFPILEKHKLKTYMDDLSEESVYTGKRPERALQFLTTGSTLIEAEKIIEELQGIPDLSLHKIFGWTPGDTWVAIAHKEATKEHGIRDIAKILGITPDEMIGIGDGHNDIPLLRACGLKVAMGNGDNELKAMADYIAPSVKDDGVADVIEKFILA